MTATPDPARLQVGASRNRVISALLALGVALCTYAWWITVPRRVDALPSVFVEIWIFVMILVALTVRDPLGTLRLSNPALSMVSWMYYYFIKPTLVWLAGFRMGFESVTTVLLEVPIVVEVQILHCYFMCAFFAAYFVLAPRRVVVPIFSWEKRPLLPVTPFLLLGVATYIWTFIERIATTGSIMPTASYGENTTRAEDSIIESRLTGGAGYFVMQVISKVWYFPLMALGLGLGVLLARNMTQRQWLRTGMIFALVPVMLLLGSGSRSYVAYPFILAFMIADGLSGPYRWWRLAPLFALAMRAFDFYGFYRGHLQKGIREGIDASLHDIEALADTVHTEDAAMLSKEAYCVFLVNHGREFRGIGYFADELTQLLPAQIAPEKRNLFSTAEFLSNELIGYGRYASGAAGAMVGDGYFIGGTLGVIGLAAVLGATFALVVRWGMSGEGGRPALWRYLLMVMISVQSTQYIRSSYSVVLVQILYYVILPAIVVRVIEGARFSPNSVWWQRLDTISPAPRR